MAVDSRPGVLPQAVLDAMSGASAQLSHTGEILGVNAAWRALTDRGELFPSTNVTTGDNYLSACESAGMDIAAGRDVAMMVRRVLEGQANVATLDYEVERESASRRFELVVLRLNGNGFDGALITQAEITHGIGKMEALGRLAGGVAHDFNNLLTVMIGYAELLHTSKGTPATFRDGVAEILAAARRAAELNGRMLAFARKQPVAPQAERGDESPPPKARPSGIA